MKLRLLAFAFACLLPSAASAFCGLQSCPKLGPHGGDFPFEAGLRTRVTAFDIAETKGLYSSVAPRLFVKARGLALGVEAPWITLLTGDGAVNGLGNALVTGMFAKRLSYAWTGQVGLQVEVPVGEADKGLADDHYMALPWVGARYEWGASWYASGMLGYSQAVDFGHDEAEGDTGAALAKSAHAGHEHNGVVVPLYVNPHGERELQARAGVGRMLAGRFMVEGFLLGQADLSEPSTEFYARAGASGDWMLAPRFALQLTGDVPVTPRKRALGSVAVDIKAMW